MVTVREAIGWVGSRVRKLLLKAVKRRGAVSPDTLAIPSITPVKIPLLAADKDISFITCHLRAPKA